MDGEREGVLGVLLRLEVHLRVKVEEMRLRIHSRRDGGWSSRRGFLVCVRKTDWLGYGERSGSQRRNDEDQDTPPGRVASARTRRRTPKAAPWLPEGSETGEEGRAGVADIVGRGRGGEEEVVV